MWISVSQGPSELSVIGRCPYQEVPVRSVFTVPDSDLRSFKMSLFIPIMHFFFYPKGIVLNKRCTKKVTFLSATISRYGKRTSVP